MFTPEPLTDAQVQAGARPGESWDEARDRLECGSLVAAPHSARCSRSQLPVLRVDQLDALCAFQQLSPRAQLEHWGLTRPREDMRDCPSLVELVTSAQGWAACVERLPPEDRYGRLRYMVYAPGFGGWLFGCSYVGEQWLCNRLELMIGGVSHWRLASPDETERQAKAAELPTVNAGTCAS